MKLAERVGFFEAVFENPNEDGRVQRNASNRNNLASSDSCRRSRPFASVCRFCHRDDTRNAIHGLLPLSKSTWRSRREPSGAVIHPASAERVVRVRAIMENPHTGGQSLKSDLEGLVISRPRPVPV